MNLFNFIFILLFFGSTGIRAQQGNKYLTNFPPSTYNASDQNWSSVQDKNGVMFFANLNGVLINSGTKWKRIELPNGENVFSLAINYQNQLFVGAEGEFGFLKQNNNGQYIYKSLSVQLSKKDKEFSSIWATYFIDDAIYFCANEKIFKYKNNQLITYNPEQDRFHTFFKIGNHLFVREYGIGFKVFENNDFHFVLGSEIFADKKVYAVMPLQNNRYLLASRNGGMYYFNYNEKHPSQSAFYKASTILDSWLNENEVYCGKAINDNQFALGSLKNGVVLIDSNLRVLDRINSSNGLQDDAVKHIFIDANRNLWLCLNKGLAYFENSTPISYFGKQDGVQGVTECSIKFDNHFYIATDKGLRKFDAVTKQFVSTEINEPCYVLSNSEKQLFIASDGGTYEFNGKVFKLINEESSYCCYYNTTNKLLYIGTDDALLILNSKYEVIKRFDNIGSVRSIAFNKLNFCALGTSKNGVYILTPQFELKAFDIKSGLPNLYETFVFTYDNKFYLCTTYGFYEFNQDYTKIVKSKELAYKNKWAVDKAFQIKNQIWFQSSIENAQKDRFQEFSVAENTQQYFAPINSYANRIQNVDVKHFMLDSNTIYISTNQGLYVYELNKYEVPQKFNVILSKINFGTDTSHAYENFTPDYIYKPFSVAYKNNELKIIPAATSYNESQKVEFSYYLEGKETVFKEYASIQVIEYNNLTENNYTFHIKAKDVFGNETEELTFKFTINPPWYRSVWAYIAYALLSIMLISVIIKLYTKRLTQKNIELENVISERTKTIVSQNQELEYKNKEITDSINYAQRIQKSLLASDMMLNKNLQNYFVFFKPKDIVSGDFYWGAELLNNQFVLVTADSTGHGVPGAIMSMLNISCLNEAIDVQKCVEPKDILNTTRQKIIKHLSNDGSETGGKDGMDCSVILFDFDKNKFTYSAANNPVWIIRNNTIIELKPDKMPVGKHDKDIESFTQHEFEFQKNDVIYTLTDGFPDQFGGPKGKKFMYKQMKECLLKINHLQMHEQQEQLSSYFNLWKGNLEQIDDVLLIGIKI